MLRKNYTGETKLEIRQMAHERKHVRFFVDSSRAHVQTDWTEEQYVDQPILSELLFTLENKHY